MIVLGVDPGTLVTGYAVIESKNKRPEVLAADVILNKNVLAMPARLRKIYEILSDVIKKYQPDEFAIETAFYGKNAQSAMKIGQARGVAMLASSLHNIPITEYSPREVKKAVVGNGAASKDQVQAMVKRILNLKQKPKLYDVSDAIAVALCHIQRLPSESKTNQSSKLPKYKDPPRREDWKAFLKDHPDLIKRLP